MIQLANQPALSAIKIHHTGRRSLDAHLVFDGPAGNTVKLSGKATFIVHGVFGNHKQGNTLRPGRRIRELGKHQVNDVFGQVMLTSGDENLRAGDAIAAISLRDCLGSDHAEISPSMRLGQAHGAGPATLIHLGKIALLQLCRRVLTEREGRAGGEDGIQRK